METGISLTVGEFTGEIKASVINGPDIKAENTEAAPNRVSLKDTKVKAAGKSFNYTFEPHSVTALICDIS
jgi:alpha-L-arabinofuranosidase